MAEGKDKEREDDLLDRLHRIQDAKGCLCEPYLRKLAKELSIPLARVYSTASFYRFFRFNEGGRRTIRVCSSPSCYLNGSTDILRIVKKVTGLNPGESNKRFNFETTQCIGCCSEAPAMMLGNKVYGNLDEKKIRQLLK